MIVHFTPEVEAKLASSAAQQGCNPDEFAQEVSGRYLEETPCLVEAVQLGQDAIDRGDYLTHEQVGTRLARFLQY